MKALRGSDTEVQANAMRKHRNLWQVMLFQDLKGLALHPKPTPFPLNLEACEPKGAPSLKQR